MQLNAGADLAASAVQTASKRHVRGSALLLAGRLLSLGINLLGQFLIVRYLSRSDYGAFAWALAVVTIGANVNTLGMSRAISRFLPLYEVKGERGAMLGTLVIALSAVIGLGLALACAVVGGRELLAESVVTDPLSATLLLFMVALTPLQALDTLCEETAAVLIGARAIFFRRHLLSPLLKLAAVVVVLVTQGDVFLLAIGHVVASVLGILVYVTVLTAALRRHGVFDAPVRFPLAPVLGFAMPQLVTDVAAVLRAQIAVVLLESLRGTNEVAGLRAVMPVSGLVLVMLQTFRLLYVPAATRLWASGDALGVRSFYATSVTWVSVLSFPAFAMCAFLAEPLTVLIFGARYADAAPLLAVLVTGCYVHAMLGLNAYTLQMYGRARRLALISIASCVLALGLNAWLIPAHGALGAALATAVAMGVHSCACQLGLFSSGEIASLPQGCRAPYLRIAGATLVLTTLDYFIDAPPWVEAAVVLLASLWVLWSNRRALNVEGTFPELMRFSLVRRFLGSRSAP